MKLQTIERNISTNGVMSQGDFGISTSDTGHILSILRDKLYSDKFLAVLREIGTNATDANIEAGKPDVPIKVTLPTRFTPTLSIRDYGLGLSEEDIYNVYTKYGASTKRNSNLVVGQLGLGSKSPFAYNNTFTIISYHNGIKSTYIAYIDESNCGKVSQLGQEPCDETGVCIQIPIRTPDIDTFKAKAEKLYKYFSPVPECNFPIPTMKSIVSGQGWSIRPEYEDGPMAIMGNIAYPISINRLPELTSDSRNVLQCGIDITFPIGDLTMSASREALEYTDSTRKAIYTRLAAIATEVTASLRTQFEACQTVWEARLLFIRVITTGSNSTNYNSRTNIVSLLAQSQFARWRGHDLTNISLEIENNTVDGNGFSLLNARLLKSSNERPTTAGTSAYNKRVSRDSDLVVLKNDSRSSWLKRALHWRTGDNARKNILVLDAAKDRDFDQEVLKYCVANSLEGIPILTASQLELPTIDTSTTGQAAVTKPIDTKSRAKVFSVVAKYDLNKYPASSNWIASEIDVTEGAGVYVVIHGFLPVEKERAQMLQLLSTLGHDTNIMPIYGIRTELKDKLGPDWEELGSYVLPQAKSLIQQHSLLETIAMSYINRYYTLLGRFTYDKEWPDFLSKCNDPRITQAASLIVKANQLGKAMDYTRRKDITIILESLGSEMMSLISNSVKIVTDVEEDYPLLREFYFFNNGGSFRTPDWQEPLSSYINLIYKDKYVSINHN